MNLYESNKALRILEDPFSSDALKQLDQLDLYSVKFQKATRLDLVQSFDTNSLLPIYIYLNRFFSLFTDTFSVPADSASLDRIIISMTGEK